MTRTLYRYLLALHPRPFRQQFAGEMLWIFEESLAAEGAASLLADGTLSLLRQWLLRSGAWKIALAVLGAMLQITAGGFGRFLFVTQRPLSQAALTKESLLGIAVIVVACVLVMVIAQALWLRSVLRRAHATTPASPRYRSSRSRSY